MPRPRKMKKKQIEIKPKKFPKWAEALERRKQIIEYYETEGNRSKKLTYHRFQTEIARSTIYDVIKIHEKRKKAGCIKRKSAGAKRTLLTAENFRKLEELYRIDPNVTCNEACQILNLPGPSSFNRLKMFYHKLKNGSFSRFNDDVTIIDYPNAWTANSNDNDAEETVGGGNDNDAHFGDSDFDRQEFPVPNGDSDNEKKVVVDPKQKPKFKKEKKQLPKNAQRCLACFESFECETGNEANTSSKLQENLNMVFVFKTLLGLLSEELVSIMKISKGANPKDWGNFCTKCRLLVEEAAAIPKKIRELEERLVECKEQLTGAIKNTCSYKSRSVCVNENLHATRRVRDIVKKRKPIKCPRKSNPFEDGDRQAESLLPPPPVVVKQEVEDFCDTSFEPGPCSFQDNLEDSLRIPDSRNVHDKKTDIQLSFGSSITNSENDVPICSFKINENEETESMESTLTPESGAVTANSTDSIVSSSIIDIDPTPLPTSTQGICDTCGMAMRPLAIPMHKLKVHGVTMEGFTVKYCTKEGCEYKTLFNIHLKNHMKKHELELTRPYCCSWCSMRFLRRKQLDQHEEIHKNADSRPHVCDQCGSSFAVKNYLYLHKRLSHEKRYFPSTKRKRSNPNQVSSAGSGEEPMEQEQILNTST